MPLRGNSGNYGTPCTKTINSIDDMMISIHDPEKLVSRLCFLLQVINASLKTDHRQSSTFIIMFKVMYVQYRQITKKKTAFR